MTLAFDPTSDDKIGCLALEGTAELELNLDPRYQYRIIHTGDDAGIYDDEDSAKSAWISTLSGTITADTTVEDEKYELKTDTGETFGPGISKLYIVSSDGADGVLRIVRIGTPTNSY